MAARERRPSTRRRRRRRRRAARSPAPAARRYSVSAVCVRIVARSDAHDAAGIAQHGAPDRAVRRADGDAVEVHRDPLVLGRIDRLVGLDIGVALAVAVGVEDERRPALRLLLVAGLLEHLAVQPADHAGADRRRRWSTASGWHPREVEMMGGEAGVDQRELAGRRIVQRQLRGRRRRSGTTLAEGWSEPCLQKAGLACGRMRGGEPHAALLVEHRIVLDASGCPRSDRRPSTAMAPSASSFDDGVFGSRTGCLHLARGMRSPDRGPECGPCCPPVEP